MDWMDKALAERAMTIEAKKKLHRNSKINETLEKAVKAGWRVENPNANEQKWLCPCGQHMATVHSSVSDHRAAQNLRSDFRKCERTRGMI